MGSTISRAARTRKPVLEELEPRLVLSTYQPTAAEQLFLQDLNDARANPAAYGASIGVDLSYIAPAPPLALDPLLTGAAQYHSADMSNRTYFAHTDPDGRDPGARLSLFGYPWNTWGESIAAGSDIADPAAALRELITDAGVPDLGHRNQLLSNGPDYALQNQVGVGAVLNGPGYYTNYYTIDTAGNPSNPGPFITGAAFNDLNGNGKYDVGEGLGGVTIDVVGVGSVTTYDAGGYSIAVRPGTYTVLAFGGGLPGPVARTVTVGSANVRLDFTPQPASPVLLQAWVGRVYQDLLQRAPNAAEVNGWVQSLQAGLPQSDVVNTILHSAEYSQDLVTYLYRQYLNRGPTSGELAYFTGALENGAGEMAVRQALLESPEYIADHGGTAAGFVNGLYRDLLGRSPRGQEAASWVSEAGAGDPAGVVAGLLYSAEYAGRSVTAMYANLLGRAPAGQEASSWIAQVAAGSPESVIVGLVTSTEFEVDLIIPPVAAPRPAAESRTVRPAASVRPAKKTPAKQVRHTPAHALAKRKTHHA